jgi:ribosomal protein S18 acetylase RimI-like enzyme
MRDQSITIRKANISDAALISVLAAATFYEAYLEKDEAHNLAGYIAQSFEPQKIAAELADANTIYIIMFRSEKAVGYAKLGKASTLDFIKGTNVAELKRLYIMERVYGQGFGERLLNYCIDMAGQMGFDTLWLQVWEENPRARRFYAKFDFVQTGKIDVPYGNVIGTNLVLEKNL